MWTVLAPGASEVEGSDAATAQLEAWTQGELKPAPLSAGGVAEVAVDTEVLLWE